MSTLENKVAIVTGGSGGIGSAIVLALANAGAAVTINYYGSEDRAGELKQQIIAAGGKAIDVAGNVSKPDDIQKLIDETVKAFGRLDIMVNCAGVECRKSILDASEEEYDRDMGVNLKGAFFGTQRAARQMIKQGSGGRIINISSVHEDWPMPGNAAYCCSKGGMRMLARTAGVDLAPHKIGVVNVGPGAIRTPINKQTLDDPKMKKALEAAIPAGRIGSPEEVGDLVAYLASDAARYINATTCFIDGGMMHNSPGL